MAQSAPLFGPFSKPIHIKKFIEDAHEHDRNGYDTWNTHEEGSSHRLPHWDAWCALPDVARKAIEHECDITTSFAAEALENPIIYAHLLAERAAVLSSLHDGHEWDYQRKKRKRLGEDMEEIEEVSPLISEFLTQAANVSLSSWHLPSTASHFIRKSKAYEHNALLQMKPSSNDDCSTIQKSHKDLIDNKVVLTVTVYGRAVAHPHYIYRSSTHLFGSQHTLGDIYDTLPCTSKDAPLSTQDEETGLTTYDIHRKEVAGSVTCVDGTAYGDGQGGVDYASKLVSFLGSIKQPPSRPRIKLSNGPNMHDVELGSLQLALHIPNWILHHGNCEHFFVVNQIRLQHPSDPQNGLPLALHLSPPSRAICRVCENIPASFSLVNDSRLPDTPFLICSRCLQILGKPSGLDTFVIPLIKYT